jgi:hypothetical protein
MYRHLPVGTDENYEISQDSPSPCRYLTQGTPEYEADVLITRPRRSDERYIEPAALAVSHIRSIYDALLTLDSRQTKRALLMTAKGAFARSCVLQLVSPVRKQ